MDFKLGKVVMTRGICNCIGNDENFGKEILKAFLRYKKCDWGEMCQEDKDMNNEAIRNGNDRILAAYETSKGKIYIITEWDRSITTILFAHEY